MQEFVLNPWREASLKIAKSHKASLRSLVSYRVRILCLSKITRIVARVDLLVPTRTLFLPKWKPLMNRLHGLARVIRRKLLWKELRAVKLILVKAPRNGRFRLRDRTKVRRVIPLNIL